MMRVGKIPILFKNKQECCGCSACEAICPVGAIEMILDFEGFFIQILMKASAVVVAYV